MNINLTIEKLNTFSDNIFVFRFDPLFRDNSRVFGNNLEHTAERVFDLIREENAFTPKEQVKEVFIRLPSYFFKHENKEYLDILDRAKIEYKNHMNIFYVQK